MSLVTEHQNSGQPQIVSFSTDNTVLSGKTFVDPQGIEHDHTKANLSFQSTLSFLKCIIRTTKDGDEYDMDTGILVYEITGSKLNPRPAYTEFTATVLYDQHLTKGDGIYRVGLYLLDINNVWNYEYLLIDKNGKNVLDKNNNQMYVQAEEVE